MDTHAVPFGAIPRLAFSIAETEVASGLSRSSLYRLMLAGKLRTVQLGRRRVVPAAELARLMGTQQESAA
jgi:predicted DNA-binding transcriptional regulator AlpA